MNKNEEYTITITDMTTSGEGVGRVDGYALFVKDTVPGDTARVKVMKTKKTYGYARLMEIITPSPDRVVPPCPNARACGGCTLMAWDYEKQLEYKNRLVAGNLSRIGGIACTAGEDEASEISDTVGKGEAGDKTCAEERRPDDKTCVGDENRPDDKTCVISENYSMPHALGMEKPYRYRNKAQFPVGLDRNGNIVMGFYAGRTHDIIPCEDCLIGSEINAPILAAVREYMEECTVTPYDENTGKGLVRHILIREGFSTGEVMVCLVINDGKLPGEGRLVEKLLQTALPDIGPASNAVGNRGCRKIASIMLNVNTKNTNVILGDTCRLLYGREYIEDYIGDIKFRISPLSFYQVNPVQTRKLYDIALDYAGLTGNETVWDLYCGIGTISLFLAKKAGRVYGVEIVPQAIEDAKENAKLNGITNAGFYVGKAEEVAPDLYEKEGIHADVVCVDPPRKGCEESLLATIVQMAPKRIVYVSCDSATLARDVKFLTGHGYRFKKAQAVDQFCHTGHVETVSLLSRTEGTTREA